MEFDTTVLKWEVRRLSSGERQRLSLLYLLADRPRVLLLDEPTANLDTADIEKVELISGYRLNHQATVIWVSHELNQLARVADRCFIVKSKRVPAHPLAPAHNRRHPGKDFGSPPLEAVKYQILIMFLIAGGTGFGTLTALWLGLKRLFDERHRLRLDRLRL